MIAMRPILSALLRNRTGAVLVAIQIAIALAVLVNAVYIVKQRVDKIGRPTGMDTDKSWWCPAPDSLATTTPSARSATTWRTSAAYAA